MQEAVIHQCRCGNCVRRSDHPDRQLHGQMNLLASRLDEQQRRWFVAIESKKVGHGGDRLMSLITGMHVETIRRGRRELDGDLQDRPADRVRLPGGGRPSLKKTTHNLKST